MAKGVRRTGSHVKQGAYRGIGSRNKAARVKLQRQVRRVHGGEEKDTTQIISYNKAARDALKEHFVKNVLNDENREKELKKSLKDTLGEDVPRKCTPKNVRSKVAQLEKYKKEINKKQEFHSARTQLNNAIDNKIKAWQKALRVSQLSHLNTSTSASSGASFSSNITVPPSPASDNERLAMQGSKGKGQSFSFSKEGKVFLHKDSKLASSASPVHPEPSLISVNASSNAHFNPSKPITEKRSSASNQYKDIMTQKQAQDKFESLLSRNINFGMEYQDLFLDEVAPKSLANVSRAELQEEFGSAVKKEDYGRSEILKDILKCKAEYDAKGDAGQYISICQEDLKNAYDKGEEKDVALATKRLMEVFEQYGTEEGQLKLKKVLQNKQAIMEAERAYKEKRSACRKDEALGRPLRAKRLKKLDERTDKMKQYVRERIAKSEFTQEGLREKVKESLRIRTQGKSLEQKLKDNLSDEDKKILYDNLEGTNCLNKIKALIESSAAKGSFTEDDIDRIDDSFITNVLERGHWGSVRPKLKALLNDENTKNALAQGNIPEHIDVSLKGVIQKIMDENRGTKLPLTADDIDAIYKVLPDWKETDNASHGLNDFNKKLQKRLEDDDVTLDTIDIEDLPYDMVPDGIRQIGIYGKWRRDTSDPKRSVRIVTAMDIIQNEYNALEKEVPEDNKKSLEDARARMQDAHKALRDAKSTYYGSIDIYLKEEVGIKKEDKKKEKFNLVHHYLSFLSPSRAIEKALKPEQDQRSEDVPPSEINNNFCNRYPIKLNATAANHKISLFMNGKPKISLQDAAQHLEDNAYGTVHTSIRRSTTTSDNSCKAINSLLLAWSEGKVDGSEKAGKKTIGQLITHFFQKYNQDNYYVPKFYLQQGRKEETGKLNHEGHAAFKLLEKIHENMLQDKPIQYGNAQKESIAILVELFRPEYETAADGTSMEKKKQRREVKKETLEEAIKQRHNQA